VEIVGEYRDLRSEKRIWKYFRWYWQECFPKLGCRTSFVRQCDNTTTYGGWRRSSKENSSFLFIRLKRKKNPFMRVSAVGYCAAKDEKYFAFKGHILISSSGVPLSFTLAPANVNERDVLSELVEGLKGILAEDKGLIRPELKEFLKEFGLSLETPLRSNMKETRPPWFVRKIKTIRNP
jgi:hypothetical protein